MHLYPEIIKESNMILIQNEMRYKRYLRSSFVASTFPGGKSSVSHHDIEQRFTTRITAT